MMSNVISRLKNYHSRMTTAISELERLGIDEDDFDYDEIASKYGDVVQKLEHRREVIQRRKYGK